MKTKTARFGISGAVYKLLFTFLLTLSISSESFAAEGGWDVNVIRISTGSVDGVYFPIGVSMCNILNENVERNNIVCLIEASDGSIDNYKKVAGSVNIIGIVQSDVKKFLDANPEILNAEEKTATPKALFSLHSEPVHLFVRRNRDINHIRDLADVRVGLSKQKAGTSIVEFALLDFENIDRQNTNFVQDMGTNDKLNAFCAGEIDAFFYVAGISSAIALQAVKECEAEVLSVDDAFLDKFLSEHLEYTRIEIPAGVYANEKEEISTFGPTALLIASENSDDSTIYNFTQYVLGELNTLVNSHVSLKELNVKDMAQNGITLPLHPGSREYFQKNDLLPSSTR